MTACRIGPAGWTYRDWEGVVYPPGSGRSFDRLAYLAGYFDVIEVNMTFYRLPEARLCRDWVARTGTNPEFRFTVKLHQNFTHYPGKAAEADFGKWKTGIAPLGEADKLGAVLAQFPYSFHYTAENQRGLGRLADRFPEHPLVVEVRHRSWDCPEAFRFLRDQGLGYCVIDQPRVSYSILPLNSVTSPVGYIRLHGRNVRDWFRKTAGRDERYNYLYTPAEIAEWRDRIAGIAPKTRELYVIANNHFRGQAACNALQLEAEVLGRRVAVPPLLLQTYPELKEIAGKKK
ncbi:MAG: DUF72 domain-containing protein [Candidatus Erginobacter occultus]|nr:DUF72 domain-containing protein [Candidatus Erginobacter occultus]